jgi:hypothetical protein
VPFNTKKEKRKKKGGVGGGKKWEDGKGEKMGKNEEKQLGKMDWGGAVEVEGCRGGVGSGVQRCIVRVEVLGGAGLCRSVVEGLTTLLENEGEKGKIPKNRSHEPLDKCASVHNKVCSITLMQRSVCVGCIRRRKGTGVFECIVRSTRSHSCKCESVSARLLRSYT